MACSTSWVAIALPPNSTSTQPSRTITASAEAAPVCTTAGPTTHRIRLPAERTSRIWSAICCTTNACGFSLDTSEFMNVKPPSSPRVLGRLTRTPAGPHTTRSPASTSLTGTVRTDGTLSPSA